MSGFHVFTLFGIPVAVGPWFLLLLLFWGASGSLQSGLIWGSVVTLSILVHEFGHALLAKYFRLSPRILLHGLGGLTAHEHAKRDRDDALIIVAGPAAGLALGAMVWLYASSGFSIAQSEAALLVEAEIVSDLLYVNIFWSFVNLLPLYPLDGGQLFRLGLLKLTAPHRAERVTHVTGIAFAMLWIYVGYAILDDMLLPILGAWLLLANFRAMQSGARPIRLTSEVARDLFRQIQAAFEAQHFDEAVRLAQRLRAEANLPDKMVSDLWRILGVSNARIGHYDEALSYLKRAGRYSDVVEAEIECFLQLGREAELAAVLGSAEFQKLGSERQQQILEIVQTRA